MLNTCADEACIDATLFSKTKPVKQLLLYVKRIEEYTFPLQTLCCLQQIALTQNHAKCAPHMGPLKSHTDLSDPRGIATKHAIPYVFVYRCTVSHDPAQKRMRFQTKNCQRIRQNQTRFDKSTLHPHTHARGRPTEAGRESDESPTATNPWAILPRIHDGSPRSN